MKCCIVVGICLSFWWAIACSAQVVPKWVPVGTHVNTRHGVVYDTKYEYRTGERYHRTQRESESSQDEPTSTKYIYTIELASDSSFQTEGAIYCVSGKYFLSTTGPDGTYHAISPSETKSVSRVTDAGLKLVGAASDSCWLFPAVFGKINGYAPLAEMKMADVTAIQKGDGPIVPFTKENFLSMIDEVPPPVQKFVDRGQLKLALRLYNNTSGSN